VNARPLSPAASARILALGALLALVAVELARILIATGGHLIYSLDDPYIHLELARSIAHGHYGLNPGEPAAPSSSILWPLLLAPVARLPFAPLAPLLLNLAAAVASLLVFDSLLREVIGPERAARHRGLVALLTILLCLATNIVGLIFTGMEHSLHLLIALLAVRGLVAVTAGRAPPWWLVPVLVLGPLVRYESVAISGPALLLLIARGHWRPALLGGGALALALGGFSLFLHRLGLDPLPTSVQAKTVAFTTVQLLPGLSIRTGIFYALRTPAGCLLLVALCMILGRLPRLAPQDPDRGLAAALALAVALHLFGGRIGWFWRYELYVVAAALAGILYLYRGPITRLLDVRPAWWSAALLALCLLPAALLYLPALLRTPASAADVYRQHYQLHRFLTAYYPRPAAVNDIGWTSYRNDSYVLDLYGLASPEALRLRTERREEPWMESLVARHQVELVMIYDGWFRELPAGWQPLAVLVSTNDGGILGGQRVTFYATSPELAGPLRAALARFAPTLPPGATLKVAPSAAGPSVNLP
jgi:hypothetical protein